MPTHETKFCPRCRTEFECRVGAIHQCQCTGVKLTAEQRAYIAQRYSDCLCADCLLALRREYNELQHQTRIEALLVR
jgi:hypothetical protein